MKMSVMYYSKGGNTKKMAEMIVEGMLKVDGVEAKAFSIDAVDEDFAKESKCIVAGTPIYVASTPTEMHAWLQGGLRKYEVAGKLGGAFATANYIHGGGELGIHTILDHMMVMGMLTYSGGGSFGNPVIHLGPVGIGGNIDDFNETFRTYGERMATKTVELFS